MTTSERREPVISGMRPDQDDIAAPPSSRSNASAGNTRSGAPVSARPVVVKSKLAPFALLLAFGALGFAGFIYMQFMQVQQALMDSNARIASLESQLEMTGDESTASLAAVQDKLKWADSEIRKLWGVSYDTNRKKIATNEKTLVSLNGKVNGMTSKVSKSLSDASIEVKLLNDVVATQRDTISAIEQNQTKLADSIGTVLSEHNAVKAKVDAHDEAIEAIDGFRRSVNRDLLQLKGGAP